MQKILKPKGLSYDPGGHQDSAIQIKNQTCLIFIFILMVTSQEMIKKM